MKNGFRTLTVALFALLCMAASAQNDKALLVYKAAVGQVVKHESKGALTLTAQGQQIRMEFKEVQKVTFTGVLPNGDISMEQETESSEVSINGRRMPPDNDKNKSSFTIHKDGSLATYKPSSAEQDPNKVEARLLVSTSPVFTDKPVGVGDKWSIDYKANSDIGTRGAKADYEVLAFEKAADADVVKIKMSYRETEGSQQISAVSTLWVEKSSGDTVKAEYEVKGVPLQMGEVTALAEGKMTGERIQGTPLGGGRTASPPKPKTIDDIVKDYEKKEGLFTLYSKKDQGRETLYLEIKEDQLDKLFMMQVTAATGTAWQVAAGDPINDLIFKFVKRPDEKLAMVVPNFSFRAPEGTPLARAVRRSFADGIIEAFKIEATHPERKSLLINVSDLFKGDIAGVSTLFRPGGGILGGGGGNYTLDRDKTYVASAKMFPENLIVETAYHFMRPAGAPIDLGSVLSGGATAVADLRSIPLNVSYYLFELKDTGYKPRLADPRVGYFFTEYQDFSDDGAFDQKVRYIYRWDVQKADPQAALSPPKKPIVFWLDNAIPEQYRPAIRDALLLWNKGFEQIGIKDAIVVKQMPDDADWDHADMRYNTIRWVTSPNNGYAVALFRVNPLTGQILNANITVDANLVRAIKLERKQRVEPSALFFEDLKEAAETPGAVDPAKLAALNSQLRCNMAQEAMMQAWFGHLAISLLNPAVAQVSEKVYIDAFLRYVVSHEMGHIMGLRHNFIGSTQHDLTSLANPKLLEETGVTGSVMDYVGFNISALKKKDVPYWSQTIGPYDVWAIKYGYVPIDSATPSGELFRLRQIAAQCNAPGHAYQSDEMAEQFDPCVVRWDVSSDPIGYWTRVMEVSGYLMKNLGDRLPKKGESYWEFTRDFNTLLGFYSRGAAVISRYIGGMHVNRNHRGDPNEKPTLAPAKLEDQKKALDLLNRYVFARSALNFPAGYFQKMTPDPFGPDLASILTGQANPEFPVRDTIAGIQRGALTRLFNPVVLRRVVNNEFRAGDVTKALTLPELFRSVGNNVWAELATKSNTTSLRRQLQRAHLSAMIDLAVKPSAAAPEDAKMLAWDQLRSLKARILAAKSPQMDEYTRVHLDESLVQINRALDARMTIGSAPTGGSSLLQLLSGGVEAKN